jgi:DNA-binding protein H-NS
MARENELLQIVKNIRSLLYDEKDALIKNDGYKIEEIVESKTRLIDKLEELKNSEGIKNILESESLMEIIEEIDSLQQTNMLLTKQAIAYQEMLMESIAESVKKAPSTYSKKASYSRNNNISFIDQSV